MSIDSNLVYLTKTQIGPNIRNFHTVCRNIFLLNEREFNGFKTNPLLILKYLKVNLGIGHAKSKLSLNVFL